VPEGQSKVQKKKKSLIQKIINTKNYEQGNHSKMASWCIEIGQTFREHEFANVILLKRNSS
jgi:hypothetical protein